MTLRHVRALRCLVACAMFALLTGIFPATPARAAGPQLWLPTPVGETWQVLQGFQCGSHRGHQARSLDLINPHGRTSGAPVRAAADGTTFVWQGRTGTLILSHGGGFYSMYTHMRRVITKAPGLFVTRGSQIGEVGSVGTDVAHLHFSFFSAPDAGAYRRSSLELNFGEGYRFHNTSGCNQHKGALVVAAPAAPDGTPPSVAFNGGQPDRWFCDDVRVEFALNDNIAVSGFSQSFDQPPGDDAPIFTNGANAGYVQLAWAGEGTHTLHIRAWDVSGERADVSFGPLGYDVTPPHLPAPEALPSVTVDAEQPIALSWQPADDGAGSGIAGYKLYLGPDPQGTADFFSDKAEALLPAMPPGSYLLRAQAQDRGCKSSAWVTVKTVVVQ